MDELKVRIIQITNFESRKVIDGGTSREEALSAFLAERGALRLVVQDAEFSASRLGRIQRLARLMREIRMAAPELVVLSYPSYPFYWQHRVTPYFLTSLMFASALLRESRRSGFKIAIDIMDLPAFQYDDLGFSIEMGASTIRRFDRFTFSRADCLWVCSRALANLVNEHYGIDESRLIIALNGHDMSVIFRQSAGGPLRFAYAGSLNRERGIGALLAAFLRARADEAELHLCGPYGDWIKSEYQDSRVIYHGALTDSQAIQALAGCDVGVIPYPEQGYYHLAFATKLPFYMALGLPVLCSNALETAGHVERLGVGMCWPIDDFSSAFVRIAGQRGLVSQWRERVMEVRGEFDWDAIYARALDATLAGCSIGASKIVSPM